MNFSEFKIMILGFAFLTLTACGGGSGGTTTTAPADVSFLTVSPDTDDIGESQRFSLKGTASGNGQTESLTGSFTITRRSNQKMGGIDVKVIDTVFVVTFKSQGTSISSSGTSYVEFDETLIVLRLDTGVECYPDSNYRNMPASVKIGESGVLGSSTCSDGTTLSSSYLVEKSSRKSNWAAVRLFATYSEPGIPEIFEDIVTHISTDGRIHALEINAGDGSFTMGLRT